MGVELGALTVVDTAYLSTTPGSGEPIVSKDGNGKTLYAHWLQEVTVYVYASSASEGSSYVFASSKTTNATAYLLGDKASSSAASRVSTTTAKVYDLSSSSYTDASGNALTGVYLESVDDHYVWKAYLDSGIKYKSSYGGYLSTSSSSSKVVIDSNGSQNQSIAYDGTYVTNRSKYLYYSSGWIFKNNKTALYLYKATTVYEPV